MWARSARTHHSNTTDVTFHHLRVSRAPRHRGVSRGGDGPQRPPRRLKRRGASVKLQSPFFSFSFFWPTFVTAPAFVSSTHRPETRARHFTTHSFIASSSSFNTLACRPVSNLITRRIPRAHPPSLHLSTSLFYLDIRMCSLSRQPLCALKVGKGGGKMHCIAWHGMPPQHATQTGSTGQEDSSSIYFVAS